MKEESKVKDERVKREGVKGEHVKKEVKSEHSLANVKSETPDRLECYISKIDHSKKAIDFASLPEDVVKQDLLQIGIRVCTLNRKQMAACIEDTWTYRKTGEIPFRFFDLDNPEENEYLKKFNQINQNKKEYWDERRKETLKWRSQ